MSRLQIVLAAATLALSLSALAEDKKDPGAGAEAMPQPSKELEAWMKPIDGTWKCDSKMMPGSMGPGSPEITGKSTVKFSKDKDSNGMWYRGEYSMPKSKEMPKGMSGTFMMTNDDAHKQLTIVGYDSMGGASMGTGTINGDTITWTGEAMMMGQKMKTRETMTKTGPKTSTHKMEADMGKGFQPMGEDTCTKS